MNFNSIQLSAELIDELYSNRLVNIKEFQEPAGLFTVVQLKHGCWLVNNQFTSDNKDEDFKFLSAILDACKFSKQHITLINSNTAILTLNEVMEKYKPEFLILSDMPENWHHHHFTAYTVHNLTGYSVLITDSLELIRTDKSKKNQLWLALKQMLTL